MTDIFSIEKRSEIMKRVRNRNTNIELLLRKGLHRRGFRFKLKTTLFGKPDIVLTKHKVVIFCDGDFWHGKNYKKEKMHYLQFWQDKIMTNMRRDKTVNKTLKKQGWTVLRFWKTDILKDPDECVNKISRSILKV